MFCIGVYNICVVHVVYVCMCYSEPFSEGHNLFKWQVTMHVGALDSINQHTV